MRATDTNCTKTEITPSCRSGRTRSERSDSATSLISCIASGNSCWAALRDSRAAECNSCDGTDELKSERLSATCNSRSAACALRSAAIHALNLGISVRTGYATSVGAFPNELTSNLRTESLDLATRAQSIVDHLTCVQQDVRWAPTSGAYCRGGLWLCAFGSELPSQSASAVAPRSGYCARTPDHTRSCRWAITQLAISRLDPRALRCTTPAGAVLRLRCDCRWTGPAKFRHTSKRRT